jgi:transposase InsO family protein
MPWKDVDLMSQRMEFVMLAMQEECNISALCHRFGVSRKTAYKWMERYRSEGREGLADRSRAPKFSPMRTAAEIEAQVVTLRDAHPAWGGRKLQACLDAQGHIPPAPSTITDILRRNGRLHPEEGNKHAPWRRFEHEAPNDLWQMDFKGDFPLTRGGRCHPLTIVDDHSRYAVCVRACGDQRRPTVQTALTGVFRAYGLPSRVLADNGACWGAHNQTGFHTALAVWLIRIGVGVTHGRIYHPQTQGKNERFNRTLQAEAISSRVFRDIPHCQAHFDNWRDIYNLERPHEALAMQPPITRFRPSSRPFPETLSPIEYAPGDIVRTVYANATVAFRGKILRVGKAFIGQPVAVRPTAADGLFDVFYCHQRIARFDLRRKQTFHPTQGAFPPPGGRKSPLHPS